MKKITNFFGIPLTVLFSIVLLWLCLTLLENLTSIHLLSLLFGVNAAQIMGTILTVILLLIFGFGVVYLVIVVFVRRANKKPNDKVFAKKMMHRGIAGVVISFVCFYLLTLALSFFTLPMTVSPPPKISPPEDFTGFPVKDLQIIGINQIKPGDNTPGKELPDECEVTIKNTNATLTARSPLFKSTENKDYTNQPYFDIPPNSSYAYTINGMYAENACAGIFIKEAGIYKL